MTRRGLCRYCGRPVVWVRTEGGKTMPIDPMPNPAGNVVAQGAPDGGARARVLTTVMSNDPAYAGRDRFMPHAASCDAKRRGRPAAGAPQSDHGTSDGAP